MQQDIRHYSEEELSLRVFNTESLYNIRHDPCLPLVLASMYDYTEEQMNMLLKDLAADKEEV